MDSQQPDPSQKLEHVVTQYNKKIQTAFIVLRNNNLIQPVESLSHMAASFPA